MGEVLEGQEHTFKPFQVSIPHIIYTFMGVFIVAVSFHFDNANSSSLAHWQC